MADQPLTRVATAIGAGLLAGAAGKVLGVQPRNPAGRARFSTAVHWSYHLVYVSATSAAFQPFE